VSSMTTVSVGDGAETFPATSTAVSVNEYGPKTCPVLVNGAFAG
jgi:hypothetical protein